MIESSSSLTVARPVCFDFFFKETSVDLVNDLKVTWENLLEERNAPLLQRLWEKRVVGVIEGRANDCSKLRPKQGRAHQ